MSILSKIFIVLLVVGTIALSVAVVVAQRNYLGWRSKYEETKLALNDAYRANNAHVAEEAKLKNEIQAIAVSRDDTISKLNGELAASRNEVNITRAELATVKKDLEIARYEINRLASLASRMEEENSKLRNLLTDGNKRIMQLQVDYQGSQEALTKAQTELDFLVRQAKITKEEVETLRDRIRELESGQTAAAPAGDTPMEGPPIRGQVTAVSGEYATINVGAAHGVKPGMRFTVFRGPNYLAQMVVSRVEAASSVGKLELVRQSVQINDKAWNKLDMN